MSDRVYLMSLMSDTRKWFQSLP